MRVLQPAGWAKPKGYANGIAASGEVIFVAGTIGWNGQGIFETDDFVGQVRQALQNTVDILRAGGAGPEHVTRQTWYVVNKKEYVDNLPKIGAVWRDIMGKNFPAMALVQVVALVEDRAKVEIETTAVVPNPAA
jgi:enamine deaminase RidA (YjgF/YER057c/UK114 family)